MPRQPGADKHMVENPPNTTHWPRSWKSTLLTRKTQFALDTIVLTSAFIIAYLLRFDFEIPQRDTQHMLYQLPFVLLLQIGLLWLAGIYTFIWRYVGMAEVKAFITAALWSALPLITLRIWLPEQLQPARVPLSITVMDTVFAFGGVLGLRVLRRALYERDSKRQNATRLSQKGATKKPVLLIGAGRAGVMVAREIRLRGNMDLDVKGFIDDDPNKLRSVIQGVKVLGRTEDIPRLVSKLNIDDVVISFAEASRRDFRRILDICEQAKVRVRTVPGIYELLQGNVKVSRIRDVQIEDLLGREQVQLDEESMRRFLAGKTVMITGAGGSIGSELVRQVARFQPARLLLVERAEFALFGVEQELNSTELKVEALSLVADVGDEARMHTIFQNHRPQVILHAAAHKHVPMMEFNPSEAIRNNVLATRSLGEMASEFGVETFVLISTDKAVCPTSIMGASKRVAELVVQDLNRSSATRFLAVRFGNVIGSAGSVIPTFREQIRRGGPVTVTHPEMVRYFMTIPEAAQLVLQAGALGEGGEIFILDMGEPVRILDLAKDTITLSGLRPFEDISIVFTGIRPGEKLFEELQTTEEQMIRTRHPKIFIGRLAAYPEQKIRHALERLSIFAENGWDGELRKALNDLLPEAQLHVPGEEFATAQPVLEAVSQRVVGV
ncbi:MAG: polysaccharide biosynthesis protein [Pyrinomonadaceae bacterium]